MLSRPWWETTIFYEGFDEPNTGYTWGVVMHDDAAPGGYRPKPVMDLLKKAGPSVHFGGTAGECADGLDDDGDDLIDFPADPDCASATSASEGPIVIPDGGGTSGSSGSSGTSGASGSSGTSGASGSSGTNGA